MFNFAIYFPILVLSSGGESLLSEFIKGFEIAYQNAGWLGAFSAILIFAIRFYRMDWLQSILPSKAKWAFWPKWTKYLLPFALSFAGAIVYTIGTGGVGWAAAIAGAFSAAVAATVGHKSTKFLGEIEGLVKIVKNPNYQPGGIRKTGNIVIPLAKFLKKHGQPPIF